MKRGTMTSKLGPSFRAFYLAFFISTGFLFIRSSSAADRDDHSYLPPWMLNEAGAVRAADEKAGPPGVPPAEGLQSSKAEVPPANESNSTGLTAKATLARKKIVGFVSGLFKRSISFATGE
jgi:hypothetical protein